MRSLLDDPEHWRDRAAVARALAAEMKNPEARRAMLIVAKSYDTMARKADKRLADRKRHGDG